MARFAFGGLAAPLVGLGGAENAVPLGLVTVVSAALATIVYAVSVRGHASTPPVEPDSVRLGEAVAAK
jgi:DHA1 family bicyclomycin/chloramphenicol resistance-like MFS transporter